ncbi:MAG: hypothetical protein WC498_02165 [Candidatus Saccharimonadales bacterium]
MKYRPIPEVYEAQLRASYPDETIDQLTRDVRFADLSEQPGERIPYARLNEGASTPLVFVPGFGESIVNKASFAAELATRGFDVILPGQNRKGMLKDKAEGRLPTGAQARNVEAVLRAENLLGTTVDFTPHSYGGLVFEALVRRVAKHTPDYFQDSRAVLLASSGVQQEASLPGLVKRWLAFLPSERDADSQEFPDRDGVTGKASALTLLANVPRSLGEARDLYKKRLDFPYLISKVGSVAIVNYAEDAMYPDAFLEPGIADAMNAGCAAWSPVSLDMMPDGTIRSGRGATHDDEQFNPSRVAGALARVLLPINQ